MTGYSEQDGQVVLSMSQIKKLRKFLLIVANDGANRVFLERNAIELIAELDTILELEEGQVQ